jgi:hypothetical protein
VTGALDHVTLTWPAYWPDFILEGKPGIDNTNAWENAFDFYPVTTANGHFSLTVSNPVNTVIFRLRR